MENTKIKKIVEEDREDEAIKFLVTYKKRKLFSHLEDLSFHEIIKSNQEDKIILYLRCIRGINNNTSKTTNEKRLELMKKYKQYSSEHDESHFHTNPLMAKYLINRLTFDVGATVLDPCRGAGVFYDNFPDHVIKDYCEIEEGSDFFQYSLKVDYVIGNPPFSPKKLFWEFHLKAMKVATEGIYWLLNLNCLHSMTPKRLKVMNDKGWYIQRQHIVEDSRWFGRYTFIYFSKKQNNNYTFSLKKF